MMASAPYTHPEHKGFTLIELMVVIAVSAILIGIAVPSFNNVVLGSKLSALANKLVSAAYLARSEAIKRNAVVTLCASSTGTGCGGGEGWSKGWVVLAGSEVVKYEQLNEPGFKITEASGLNTLTFQPSGFGSTQATLTVCQATPTAGHQERVVSISATGRASVAKTETRSCA